MTTTIDLDLNPIKEDIKANFYLDGFKYTVSLYSLWEVHSKMDTDPSEDLQQAKQEIKPLYESVFNGSACVCEENGESASTEVNLTPEQSFIIYTAVCNHVGSLFKKK